EELDAEDRRQEGGLSEVRLQHQEARDDQPQEKGDGTPRKSFLMAPQRQQPTSNHCKERLHELRGLQREAQNVDPAAGPLDLMTEERHGDQQQQGSEQSED